MKREYFINAVIAFFVLAGIVLLVTPNEWWPNYYDLPYMGIMALVYAGLVRFFPRVLRFPFAVILLFNASGDLGFYELYRHGFEYDKIIHFISPLFATLVIFKFLQLRYNFSLKKALVTSVCIMLVTSVAWEFYEIIADKLFNTRLFGIFRQDISRDTMLDMAMNILGITTALGIKRLERHLPFRLSVL